LKEDGGFVQYLESSCGLSLKLGESAVSTKYYRGKKREI